jgi:hypothetical protein
MNSSSSLYGAFGEYERSIRERKIRIAEKEDIIASKFNDLSFLFMNKLFMI